VDESRKLTGVVYSDLGRAASFMEVETLNLRLDTAEARRKWDAVKNDARGIEIAARDATHCSARCFRVRIEGNWPGAVILPAVAGYPADKLEVIAPMRLKDALKVQDGARVSIEFVD
jgi:CTP-dependent riboflavin kinase